MTTLLYDELATRRLLAVYVTPDVIAQRECVVRALAPQPGEHVLDVGAGPGYLAAALGRAVGPDGRVHGVDISEPLLGVARTHCEALPWVDFSRGDATALTLPDESFDAVISTQVLEYVADVDAALTQMHRVLRPGGRLALVDTDWDSIVWHSSDPARMARMLDAWRDHAPHPHLPRTLLPRLRHTGFAPGAVQVIPLLNAGFEADSYSNRMVDLIAPYVEGRGSVPAEQVRDWAVDLRECGARQDYFFSLNRYLFHAVRPRRDAGAARSPARAAPGAR